MMKRPVSHHLSPIAAAVPFLGILLTLDTTVAVAQDERERCIPVERFLSEELGFVVRTDPDTMDDWRTRRIVPACRVTGARTTRLALDDEAEDFYVRLRDSGWSRTPDPRDAPNEASLRFRRAETDCLFNIYKGPLVASPAELEVSSAVLPEPGEIRFNVLVQCMPAMAAAPRGPPGGGR